MTRRIGVGLPESEKTSSHSLCHELEVARLETPMGFALEFQPPQTAQPKDATHNASLLAVVNKDNAVADLKFRLRFHDRLS
jgi:hypothetical protein